PAPPPPRPHASPRDGPPPSPPPPPPPPPRPPPPAAPRNLLPAHPLPPQPPYLRVRDHPSSLEEKVSLARQIDGQRTGKSNCRRPANLIVVDQRMAERCQLLPYHSDGVPGNHRRVVLRLTITRGMMAPALPNRSNHATRLRRSKSCAQHRRVVSSVGKSGRELTLPSSPRTTDEARGPMVRPVE